MQHDSTLFFPLASRIITCLLGHAFLSLLFRSLYLFAAVVDLLLGLFQLKNFPECISRREILATESPSVAGGHFSLRFSLQVLRIFVQIPSSIDPITLIWVSMESPVAHLK